MRTRILLVIFALLAVTATAAVAQSSFQNTCSNIAYAYSGSQPTLQAVCLTSAGTPNPTSLVLQGISNQNGKLVQGSGSSTFQQSCGNIQIVVNSTTSVTLTAFCRTSSGSSVASSLPLNGISNQNGKLAQ